MCENERLIAVEVVNDILIIRRIKVLQGFDAVVVIPADEDLYITCDFPDAAYAFSCDLIPLIAVLLVCNLIEKLESDTV